MASELFFAIPGDLATVSGGYEYDRRLIALLQAAGWRVSLLAWPGDFPLPSDAARAEARASLAKLPDGALVLLDGLAFGAVPEAAEEQRRRLRLVALVHHPLALESGLAESERRSLFESERRALACVRAALVTSASTGESLIADYDVPRARIRVARPGTDPCTPVPRGSHAVPFMLAIGAAIPRKGHDLLVAALAGLARHSWRAAIVGSLTRDPACAANLAKRITAARLGDRIFLAGEVADTAPFYREADFFVLASRHEGFGMVFAEALRHGLPVIGTRAGAIPELVPPEAGLLVSPGDVVALAAALRQMLDPAIRSRFAAGAGRAAEALPRWEDTARIVAAALAEIAG